MVAYTTNEKISKLNNPTKTSSVEMEFAAASLGLAFDSNEYERPGSPEPGSFDPNPQFTNIEANGGAPAVLQELHPSELKSGFKFSYRDWNARGRQISNGKNLPIGWTIATAGFTVGLVTAGVADTILLSIHNAQALGLTTNHLIAFDHVLTGYTAREERRVANVAGNVVRLKHPLSRVPAQNTAVTRITDIVVREGGSENLELTARLKVNADNRDIHIIHYPKVFVENGKFSPGANNKLMMLEITCRAAAEGETINSVEEPVFSREHMLPAA
jgi:hypothetical protein